MKKGFLRAFFFLILLFLVFLASCAPAATTAPKPTEIQATQIIRATATAAHSIRSITVAHMEVPCCTGIVRVVQAALAEAGREDIPVRDVTVGVDGTIARTVAG